MLFLFVTSCRPRSYLEQVCSVLSVNVGNGDRASLRHLLHMVREASSVNALRSPRFALANQLEKMEKDIIQEIAESCRASLSYSGMKVWLSVRVKHDSKVAFAHDANRSTKMALRLSGRIWTNRTGTSSMKNMARASP